MVQYISFVPILLKQKYTKLHAHTHILLQYLFICHWIPFPLESENKGGSRYCNGIKFDGLELTVVTGSFTTRFLISSL